MPITGDNLAQFATFAAGLNENAHLSPVTSPFLAELNQLDPVRAVIQCAHLVKAFSAQQAARLSNDVTQNRFAPLVGEMDPVVRNAADMRAVPAGNIIAFISVDQAGRPAHQRGPRHMLHVMVSLGGGWAAGTQGANIRLPVRTPKWEKVDLAGSLLWNSVPHSFDAIAESLGSGSARHMRIRHRRIEDVQAAADQYIDKDYQSIRFIAYEIPTLNVTPPERPQLQPPVAPGQPGPPPTPPTIPVRVDPGVPRTTDEGMRLRRFFKVAEQARATVEGLAPDPAAGRSLNLLMAPEFYFRPQNADNHNSYSRATATNLIDGLRKMFAGPEYTDWLIVPGTIFWSMPAEEKVAGTPLAFFNTACLIKGGPDGPINYIHKRHISPIDGPPMEANPYEDTNLAQVLVTDQEARTWVWTVDGITFGTEVCLDHYKGVLAEILRKWALTGVQPPLIDIHLMTSCGMSFLASESCARAGGYLFGVDGYPKPPRTLHSELIEMTVSALFGGHAGATAGNRVGWAGWENVSPDLQVQVTSSDDAVYAQTLIYFGPRLMTPVPGGP